MEHNDIFENRTEQEETFSDQSNNGAFADGNKPKKRRSRRFFANNKKKLLIGGSCLLLAAVGGFGGSMAAFALQGGVGKTVLYQSVTNDTSKNDTESDDKTMSVKQVVEATAASVVEIKTESVSTNSFYSQAITSGAGSGVIISKDGYIVTNNHVIEDANKVTVTTKDGKSYTAKLVGKDATTDLAVIKIEAQDLTPAVMGSSGKLEAGDTAIAIGNPLGELGGSVTSGIISALDRQITIDNETMHLLQTDAAINPGNSGGGLFNDSSELIGIVNAKSGGENIEGLGFAIPIDLAKPVIESLIENGYVKDRPALGVSLQETSSILNSENRQVYIVQIEKGKAADKAGLKVGDQILKVDGKAVSGISDVKSAISTKKVGDTLTLTILRDSETKEIKVTLQEAASQNAQQNTQKQSAQGNSDSRYPYFNDLP